MPMPPPPPLPPPWETERRIREGARTVAEIDPAFAKWSEDCRRDLDMRSDVLWIGGAMLLALVLLIALVGS